MTVPWIRSAAAHLFTPALLSVVVVAVALVAVAVGPPAFQRTTLSALVQLVAVIGIYLFMGLTGTFSFGQLGFMAIGAYTTAIATVPPATKNALFAEMPQWLRDVQLPFPAAAALGALLAAAVALVLSVPMARMQQLSAGLATLAILVSTYVVLGNWTAVTNGSKGMTAIPGGANAATMLTVIVVLIFAVWLFQNSALGLRIRAAREDETAARAVGVGVGRERGIAFVVSAFVMGVAGALYAQLQGNLAPDAFYLGPTFLLIAMLVVGGITTLSGAVLGTIVVVALRRVLEQFEAGLTIGDVSLPGRPGLTEVGTGVALLIVLAVRRTGLTGGRELTVDLFRRRGRPDADESRDAGGRGHVAGERRQVAEGREERARA